MDLSSIDLDQVARIAASWDGRATGRPEDRERVNEALRGWYRAAGLDPPQRIEWVGGPSELAERLAHASACAESGPNLESTLVDDSRDAASFATQRAVDALGRTRIQARLGLVATEPLRRALAAEFSSGVSRSILDGEVQRLGWRRFLPWVKRATTPQDLSERSVSRYTASWLATYQVMGEVCGLAGETHRLSGLWNAVLGASWIVPCRDVCWVAALPVAVHADTHRRLHHPTRPALEFPDGWKRYAWKGVVVPCGFIEDRAAIDGDAIARQPDPVLRRCMLEIMTPERFILEGEAVLVSSDDCGRLWRRHWSNGDVWAAVEVMNGTPEPDGTVKRYYLQVPAGMRTAREAVAWTYGLSELRYMSLKQRT